MPSRHHRRNHGRRPSSPMNPRTEAFLAAVLVLLLLVVLYLGMRA